MTDNRNQPNSEYREFDIIAFLIRNGAVYRRDKQHYRLHVSDAVSQTITERARAQAAQGRYVLVLESGVVKYDWSRLPGHAIGALLNMTQDESRQFVRGIPHADSWSFDDFKLMLIRCLA